MNDQIIFVLFWGLMKLLPHLAAASAEYFKLHRIFIHSRTKTNISAFGGHVRKRKIALFVVLFT